MADKKPLTYKCAECGGTFDSYNDQDEAEQEAENLWGVKDAASNPSMAIVCDDCWKEIVAEHAHG